MYDELCRRNPDQWLTRGTFNTVAEQDDYAWPVAAKQIWGIQVPDESDSTVLTRYVAVAAAEIEISENDFDGPVFYRMGDYFYLNPAPAYSGTANGVYLYLPLLADLTKIADVLNMPQGMRNVVMLRAAADIAGYMGLPNANYLQGQYEATLATAAGAARTTRTQSGVKYSETSLRVGCYDDDN